MEFPVLRKAPGNYQTGNHPHGKQYQLPGFETKHFERLIEDDDSLNVAQELISLRFDGIQDTQASGGAPGGGWIGGPFGLGLLDPGGPTGGPSGGDPAGGRFAPEAGRLFEELAGLS